MFGAELLVKPAGGESELPGKLSGWVASGNCSCCCSFMFRLVCGALLAWLLSPFVFDVNSEEPVPGRFPCKKSFRIMFDWIAVGNPILLLRLKSDSHFTTPTWLRRWGWGWQVWTKMVRFLVRSSWCKFYIFINNYYQINGSNQQNSGSMRNKMSRALAHILVFKCWVISVASKLYWLK